MPTKKNQPPPDLKYFNLPRGEQPCATRPRSALSSCRGTERGLRRAFAFDETKYPTGRPMGPHRRSALGSGRSAQRSAPIDGGIQGHPREKPPDQVAGGHGTEPTHTCLAPGMPRAMNVYEPMEIVVTPHTTTS